MISLASNIFNVVNLMLPTSYINYLISALIWHKTSDEYKHCAKDAHDSIHLHWLKPASVADAFSDALCYFDFFTWALSCKPTQEMKILNIFLNIFKQ